MAAPLRSLEVTRVEDACSSDAADGRRLRVRQEDVLASLQLKGVAVEPHLEHALPLERAAQPRVVEAVHVVLDVVQQGRVGQRLGRLAAEDRAAGEQLEHERLRLLLDLSIDEHFDAHLLLVAQQRDGAARPRRARDGRAADAAGDVGGLVAEDAGEERRVGRAAVRHLERVLLAQPRLLAHLLHLCTHLARHRLIEHRRVGRHVEDD
mmetsp:Transcript_4316/g.13620  ORF Transcript_4316/g.13620 Transcript_4316/m.13620 type:complete len:208 (+) Transcript_4316:159-782(+)